MFASPFDVFFYFNDFITQEVSTTQKSGIENM